MDNTFSYEQAYKNALERAKQIKHDVQNIGCKMDADMLDIIFPELRESEDEKVRKAIFKALSKKDARDILLECGVQVSDALAYLEKQKVLDYDTYKNEREVWVENTISDTFPQQDGDFISEEDYRNILRRTANHFYMRGVIESEKQKEQKDAFWCGDGIVTKMKRRCVREKEQKPAECDKYPESKSFEDKWKEYYNMKLKHYEEENKNRFFWTSYLRERICEDVF